MLWSGLSEGLFGVFGAGWDLEWSARLTWFGRGDIVFLSCLVFFGILSRMMAHWVGIPLPMAFTKMGTGKDKGLRCCENRMT